jgi:hypothetical protein
MVEMALPDNFQDSGPRMIFQRVTDTFQQVLPGGQYIFFTSAQDSLFRPRYLNIIGQVTGGGGGANVSFECLTSALLKDPWPDSGPLTLAAPNNFADGDQFSITWSTEIADNYSGLTASWGVTVNLGMPLVYLPQDTDFLIACTQVGAPGSFVNVLDGLFQYEMFPPSALAGGGGSGGENVYLLPQTI